MFLLNTSFPSTLIWKVFEPLQKKLGKNSIFKGANWKNELNHYANAINTLYARTGASKDATDIQALRNISDEATFIPNDSTVDVPRVDGQERFVVSVSDGASPTPHTTYGVYKFHASSTATDNDASANVDTDGIVAPTSGTGRWHRVGMNHAIVDRGHINLRTLKARLKTDLSVDTVTDDVVVEWIARSLATSIKVLANKKVVFRDGSDGADQDIAAKDITASGSVSSTGIINATAGVDFTNDKAVNLAAGTNPADGVNKEQMEAAITAAVTAIASNKLLYSATSFASISGGTETSLVGTGVGSMTIGANTLAVGDKFRIRVLGSFGGSDFPGSKFKLRFKVAGSAVLTMEVADDNFLENWLGDNFYELNIEGTVTAIGASGVLANVSLHMLVNPTQAEVWDGTAYYKRPSRSFESSSGSIAIDTTQDRAFDVSYERHVSGNMSIQVFNFGFYRERYIA